MKDSLKITTILLIALVFVFLGSRAINAGGELEKRLSGKLLLQVEDGGIIWYVNPNNLQRYLVNKNNAVDIFRSFALGITNYDLDRIPTNADYLNDSNDSDADGYGDKIEALFGYNLFSRGRSIFDLKMVNRLKGKFLLQVEDNGRIWYVNPDDGKKYEIKKENTMFIFQNLSLGINNNNLEKIAVGNIIINEQLENSSNESNIELQTEESATPEETPVVIPLSPVPASTPTPSPSYPSAPSSLNIISSAARSIASGLNSSALAYFTAGMQSSMQYTLNALDNNGKSIFADLLLNASLKSNSSNMKIYSTNVSFNNGYAAFNVTLEQQENGEWLISSL